ncbi:MAG: protease modulator HflK [Limisphaerales bacterium]
MERPLNKTGLVNSLLLLVAGVTLAVFARQSGFATGMVAVGFLIVAALTALMAWFQMTLESREEAERLELEGLAKGRLDASLFAENVADISPARRSRQQFEKWVLPAFTFLLMVLEGVGVWYFWDKIKPGTEIVSNPSSAAITLAINAAVAFVLLLVGKYSARLAQLEDSRLLRPSGSAVMLGAVVSAIAALSAGLVWAGFLQWDRYLATLLVGLLGLVAVETLFALVLEIYRPRTKGPAPRLIYESRIIGLLGQSGGLFSTAAQALDYQFGFKVSETWFYRYLEQYVSSFLLIWIGILWVSSCLVVIDPQEEGVLERFGRTMQPPLQPGAHFKLPWPIDAVYRYDTRGIREFLIGAVPDPDMEKSRVMVWTRPHYREEFNMLVASSEQLTNRTVSTGDALPGQQAVPVNLLTVSIPVQYRIRNVDQWAYQASDPQELLQRLATGAVVRYLVSVDMNEIMSHGRMAAGQALQKRIQSEADALKLGVEVVFVGLQDIHPPMGTKENQVAAAFEQVIGAIAEKEAKILEAEGYRAETLPLAQARAVVTNNVARAAAVVRVEDAAGRAAQFIGQLKADAAAPTVYRQRTYLDTLAKASAGTRKIVIGPTNTSDILMFNLEDKLRTDLGDIAIDTPPAKK